MRTGVAAGLDMLECARRHDLGLMIGGMVETRLAMTVSACLAAGHGGFAEVDLDTPFFIEDDRLLGGFTQRGGTGDALRIEHGPCLDLSHIQLGHGVGERRRGS